MSKLISPTFFKYIQRETIQSKVIQNYTHLLFTSKCKCNLDVTINVVPLNDNFILK